MTKLKFLTTSEEGNKALHAIAVTKHQMGGNLMKVASDVAPYASNIANAFRKLPKPAKPILNNAYINPELVDFDADITQTDRLIRALDAGVTTANGATGNAIKAANLGKFLEQRNKLRQEERITNAGIRNRAKEFNAGINDGNVNRLNQYRADKVERRMAQQRLQAENLADAGNKFQAQRRDKAMMDLERRRIELLPVLYKDNKVVSRNMLDQVNQERAKYGLPPLTHTPDQPEFTNAPIDEESRLMYENMYGKKRLGGYFKKR